MITLANDLFIILWNASPDQWQRLKLILSPYHSFLLSKHPKSFTSLSLFLKKCSDDLHFLIQPVQTFISKILNSKYTGVNLLHDLCISLVRKTFSTNFFPHTSLLCVRDSRENGPLVTTCLKTSSLITTVIYPKYPIKYPILCL